MIVKQLLLMKVCSEKNLQVNTLIGLVLCKISSWLTFFHTTFLPTCFVSLSLAFFLPSGPFRFWIGFLSSAKNNYFMYVSVFLPYVYAFHIQDWYTSEKSIRFTWFGVTECCELSRGCWKPNLGPLQEQLLLLTIKQCLFLFLLS